MTLRITEIIVTAITKALTFLSEARSPEAACFTEESENTTIDRSRIRG